LPGESADINLDLPPKFAYNLNSRSNITRQESRMAVRDGAVAVEACDRHVLDPEKVMQVRRQMLPETDFHALSAIFAAMGDPTRVRLLFALSHGELCVCDLAALLGASVSAVSHQLRLLRDLRVVKHRRAGRQIYYSLDDHHVATLLQQGIDHLKERKTTGSGPGGGPTHSAVSHSASPTWRPLMGETRR
jgi:DNA-binding transcriptional ArsR family regulator